MGLPLFPQNIRKYIDEEKFFFSLFHSFLLPKIKKGRYGRRNFISVFPFDGAETRKR